MPGLKNTTRWHPKIITVYLLYILAQNETNIEMSHSFCVIIYRIHFIFSCKI